MAKYLTILFVACTLFDPVQSVAQWTIQQLPTTQQLTDIYFADTSNGWVVGFDGIFHTVDGGLTWEQQFPLSVGHISGISRSEFWATRARDTLLHSIDGGEHFEKLTVGRYFDLDSVRRTIQVYFFDSLTGWAS